MAHLADPAENSEVEAARSIDHTQFFQASLPAKTTWEVDDGSAVTMQHREHAGCSVERLSPHWRSRSQCFAGWAPTEHSLVRPRCLDRAWWRCK
mmetsp:Transcript_32645/g.49256  ORF Transcript_32645/g.49256 Transcript_32645/m.49256 type:complete len:94 (-) Transcript_32645:65-346(-)